jgi:hypothetical protein
MSYVSTIDERTGFPELLETFVEKILDCSASFGNSSKANPLYCDYRSKVCKKAELRVCYPSL